MTFTKPLGEIVPFPPSTVAVIVCVIVSGFLDAVAFNEISLLGIPSIFMLPSACFVVMIPSLVKFEISASLK